MSEIKIKNDNVAFEFLINSGRSRLYSNNVYGAYSELILTYKIKPENETLINLLIETTYILCEKELKYCDELEKFLNK